ncbi:haloacid dehalogenase-like hydrolase [Anatilimnocola aggregata]|uniref:Haloacid dehalogenase-like hydrolase n=1 Tax=Anatilimnocola aggregata TaxID=2528021 RepID=A0A517YFL9_9BACT|nr:haloacid dehalogenase-like hydrolase [Anatilimnocola aggregata]QDU28962.1 haloacid dehalogenase-like hydrolase [Anatilimnocola aggregata]
MTTIRLSLLAFAIWGLAFLSPRLVWGQGPQAASVVTAIDILLNPDRVMIDHARAANDRLRVDYPKSFALDADHAPHITIIQTFVRTSELDKVYAAVAKVTKDENPTEWELKTKGYYDIPSGNLGVAGIVIEPTRDLLRLQQKLIDAVGLYTADKGTDAAFVPKPDGGAMVPGLIDYVTGFVSKSSGKNFNPHVTVGLGTREFLDKLKAEPFKSFTFKARGVAVYQLGDFGTAQKLLWTSAPADPLPSWNDTNSKQSIIDFVMKVTKDGSPDFVPVAERIATFDNDGTLWCEMPIPVQLYFAIDRVKALAPKHPEWKEKQPFKGALEDDIKAIFTNGERGLFELMMASHAGMTTNEFEAIVKDWIATAKHPQFKRPYTELVYQPMLEVLTYLRANGFKTYVVSGGGIEFMRPWMEKVYGIPPEQIIGSSIETKYELRDGNPVLVRLPQLDFNDDKAGKPVAINRFIGRRPIMAFGNSDGDFEMIEWTTTAKGPRFGLIIHHTDAEREYAYDRKAGLGRLDKGLDEASKRNWTVVNMKDDWKTVFPTKK